MKKTEKIFQVLLNNDLIFTTKKETDLNKFLVNRKKDRVQFFKQNNFELESRELKFHNFTAKVFVPKGVQIDKYEIITKTI